MDADSVERSVLDRIIPTPETERELADKSSRLKSIVLEYVASHGINAEVRFAGSYSKGTYLSNPDFDLFIMFPEDVPKEEMERIGLQAGDDILHGERIFSDHPYTRGFFEGVEVDMVPCYHLESTEHLRSAVDRTPFHTAYVMSRIDEDGKNQIRLLKKFMKGIGTYGAEQDSRGFSGYLCELLVIAYGSFRGVLEGCRKWKEGVSIVIEERGPKFKEPLVVYDPVDPRRNVASAVHLDTMCRFMVAAKSYLDDPRDVFFFPVGMDIPDRDEIGREFDKRRTRLVSVSFPRPQAIEDSLHSQLWRTQTAIGKLLERNSFHVMRAAHLMTDETLTAVFELDTDSLPPAIKHQGPPVWVASSEDFLDRWKGLAHGEPFIEDGKWTVVVDRRYRDAKTCIDCEREYAGVGKSLDPMIMTVRDHDATLRETDPSLLMEVLGAGFPWGPVS